MANANKLPDGIDTNDDGTAVLRASGERIRLRRPKVGELRKVTQLMFETQDEEGVLRVGASEEPAPEIDDALSKAEQRRASNAELRRRTNVVNEAIEKMRMDAYDEVVGLLGDKSLPEDREEWPSFLLTLQPMADLIAHWRSSPLGPGPRPQQG